MGIALAGVFSGCSIDFFKPESYAFIKDAMAVHAGAGRIALDR